MTIRAFGSLPSMIARLTPSSELYLRGGLMLLRPKHVVRPRGSTLPPSSIKPKCRCMVEAEITSYAIRRRKSERSSRPSSNVSKEFRDVVFCEYGKREEVSVTGRVFGSGDDGTGGKGFEIGIQGSSFRVLIRRILHGREASVDATKTNLVQRKGRNPG